MGFVGELVSQLLIEGLLWGTGKIVLTAISPNRAHDELTSTVAGAIVWLFIIAAAVGVLFLV